MPRKRSTTSPPDPEKRSPGRPRLFEDPLRERLHFRVTAEEFDALTAAAEEGIEGANTRADVVRKAVAFYFENHPGARAVAARFSRGDA